MPRISNPSQKNGEKSYIVYLTSYYSLASIIHHIINRENAFSLNKRNFLERVESLSKYDHFSKEYFTKYRVKESHEFISYFSPEIQNEFINILTEQVKQKNVDDVIDVKY